MSIDKDKVRCVTLTSGIVLIGHIGQAHSLDTVLLHDALRVSYDAAANIVQMQTLRPYAARATAVSTYIDLHQILVEPYAVQLDLLDRYLAVIERLEAEFYGHEPQAIVTVVDIDDEPGFVKR